MRAQWLFAGIAISAAAAAGSDVCGYVYGIRGDWRLGPQFAVTLKEGMELHAGDKIKLMGEARPAHIDVGLLNGTLWKRNCDTDSDCRDAVALPGLPAGATMSQRLRNLISGFGSHPSPMVFTLSRGGEGAPEEAVLRLAGHRVEVAPAVRSMAGAVKLRLVAINSGAAAEGECPSPANCTLPVDSPGLYKLEARAPDREPQTVLVLVAGGADYSRAHEIFSEALRTANSWGGGASPDARHYFLSATLNELALSIGKAH